jgi:uncharacterized membrane protein
MPLRLLDWSAILLLAATFILAGFLKATDAAAFAEAIAAYRLLPLPLLPLVAATLPWLEIFIGIALFIPFVRRGATLIIILLLVIFTAALFSALLRGLDAECGCFSRHGVSLKLALLRDLLLLVPATFLIIRSWQSSEEKPQSPP